MNHLLNIQNNHLKEAQSGIREVRKLNETRKIIYEQNENINKKIRTIK